MDESIFKEYLNLPQRKAPQFGRYLYITMRKLTFDASPPPMLLFGMDPYSKYTSFSLPLKKIEGSSLIPLIIKTFLSYYINMKETKEKFRPSFIYLDDFLLYQEIDKILKNSNTIIKMVDENKDLIDDQMVTNQKFPTPLIQIITHLSWDFSNEICKRINQKPKNENMPPKSKLVKDKYVIEDKENYPKKLLFCCNNECILLKDDLKKCSGCHKAHYCSAECQKVDWRNHKLICVKK